MKGIGMNYLRAAFCSFALTAGFASVSLPAIAQSMPSCPGDTVVWENTSTKVYHESGDKYFGKTKKGTYACKADADKAGFHLSGSKSKGGSMSSGASTGSTAPDTDASGAPAPGASPMGKHHKHKKGAMMGASPAPDAMTSPAPGASPMGKHHKHHKGSTMASPAPMAT
jgi:hypothetical protein